MKIFHIISHANSINILHLAITCVISILFSLSKSKNKKLDYFCNLINESQRWM
jgi:hypothetical protein